MQRGFTLTELITVMVIVGILAAVVMPRFFERNVFDSRAFHDQVVSTLRYAQKAAIAQHRFVCVAFTANSVDLTYGDNSNCAVAGGALASPSGHALSIDQYHFRFQSRPGECEFRLPRSAAGHGAGDGRVRQRSRGIGGEPDGASEQCGPHHDLGGDRLCTLDPHRRRSAASA